MGLLACLRSVCGAAVAVALLAPTPASAAGALLARDGASTKVREARLALAQGPSRTTAWYQLRFEGDPDELLWVMPVPAGAGADEGLASLLDALESATAPRVLPPPGKKPEGLVCTTPSSAETVSTGDAEIQAALLGHELFDDVASLKSKAATQGFKTSSLDEATLGQAVAAGARLLALRLDAPQGPASTPVVRLNGADVDLGALPLLRAAAGPGVPFTVWLLGDGRGRAAGAGEVEIEPSALRWLTPKQTNYGALRQAMLSKAAGANLIFEVAGAGLLRDPTFLAGGAVPPLLDAYLSRVFERGEASGDQGEFSKSARAALDKTFQEPCARGDLLAPPAPCSAAGPAEPVGVLVPSPRADDLAFVFAGHAPSRWVSRLAGLVPGDGKAPTLDASFAKGEPLSLLYTPASVWDGLCSPGSTGAGGSGSGGKPPVFGGNGSGANPGSGARGGSGSGEGETPEADSDSSSSCNGVVFADACSSSSSDGSSEGCNCNDTSEPEPDGQSSDGGCNCNDSSSGGEGSDGCSDSSGSDGGDSCSGDNSGGDSCGSNSGGGSSCGKDCSVGAGRRRPLRLSKILLVAAALALPLRRLTRGGRRR